MRGCTGAAPSWAPRLSTLCGTSGSVRAAILQIYMPTLTHTDKKQHHKWLFPLQQHSRHRSSARPPSSSRFLSMIRCDYWRSRVVYQQNRMNTAPPLVGIILCYKWFDFINWYFTRTRFPSLQNLLELLPRRRLGGHRRRGMRGRLRQPAVQSQAL